MNVKEILVMLMLHVAILLDRSFAAVSAGLEVMVLIAKVGISDVLPHYKLALLFFFCYTSDLKGSGINCQIEIHFVIQHITKY
jgi:hypothetical protein